jgi:transposase
MSTAKYTTPTPRIAYFPIDIGKNVHWFAVYTGSPLKEVRPPEVVRTHQAGFDHVASVLQDLLTSGQYDEIVIGHEPTGIYHEAWARALQSRFASALQPGATPQLRHLFINPYQTKQARQQLLGRNRKTDQLDLPAIAHCLANGVGQPAFLPAAAEFQFQQWTARWRQNAADVKVQTRRVLRELDQLWPGALVKVAQFRKAHPTLEVPAPLVLSRPLERELVQALLTHCPDPHRVRAMSEAELQKFLRTHIGRAGPVTVRRVLRCAREAVLPPPEIATILAQRVQADFATYQRLMQQRATLETEAAQLVPGSPAEVLTSIGLSPFLAARYYAGVGHHRRFQSAAEVWAFAGFDPLSSDSGDTQQVGKISRKGDAIFRDTLYLIGLYLSQHCPPIMRAKQRALKHGLGHVGAVLHAAHKANRLCWHLLYHQEKFDAQRAH